MLGLFLTLSNASTQFLFGGVLIVNLILAIMYVSYQKQQSGAH